MKIYWTNYSKNYQKNSNNAVGIQSIQHSIRTLLYNMHIRLTNIPWVHYWTSHWNKWSFEMVNDLTLYRYFFWNTSLIFILHIELTVSKRFLGSFEISKQWINFSIWVDGLSKLYIKWGNQIHHKIIKRTPRGLRNNFIWYGLDVVIVNVRVLKQKVRIISFDNRIFFLLSHNFRYLFFRVFIKELIYLK